MRAGWAVVALGVVGLGWVASPSIAGAKPQEFVAPIAQPKPADGAQPKPSNVVQPKPSDANRDILAEANRKAKEAEKQAEKQTVTNTSGAADAMGDPRYQAAYTEYAIWVLQHDRKSYEWHHTSSVIIFYVVIFLVLSGVWFSWMQFRAAHHHPVAAQRSVTTATAVPVGGAGTALTSVGDLALAPAPAVVTEEKDSVTEFSASASGIKVASSAIGVVILVISMCFFYLYLDKVYPITVMPPAQGGAAQAAGK